MNEQSQAVPTESVGWDCYEIKAIYMSKEAVRDPNENAMPNPLAQILGGGKCGCPACASGKDHINVTAHVQAPSVRKVTEWFYKAYPEETEFAVLEDVRVDKVKPLFAGLIPVYPTGC